MLSLNHEESEKSLGKIKKNLLQINIIGKE